jgi:hypothetical protein
MIKIHYDFTDGSELSIEEAREASKNRESFTTCCLNFFDGDHLQSGEDIFVLKKDGSYISLSELLDSDTSLAYTHKEIRRAHNTSKMLLAGAFNWKQPKPANPDEVTTNITIYSDGDDITTSIVSSSEENSVRDIEIFDQAIDCLKTNNMIANDISVKYELDYDVYQQHLPPF